MGLFKNDFQHVKKAALRCKKQNHYSYAASNGGIIYADISLRFFIARFINWEIKSLNIQ